MKIWIISGWVHLLIGFGIGWLVFNRPQWATDLIEKIKGKLSALKFWS